MIYGFKYKCLKHLEKFILKKYYKRITKREENKKVEFYLMDAFEIFHFLPLYKELKKQGIKTNFVCEPPEINTVHKWFDYDTAVNILNDMKLDYTQKADEYSRVAFTTQHLAVLSKYYGTKINLNYGCGFNKKNFGNTPESTKGFDYKFVHGEYMAKIAQGSLKENQIKIIGYPKHDEYFKNPLKKTDVLAKLNIQTEKPILVYFPTWDDDSSIHKFGDEISKLRDTFFVITKAHHCTFRLEEKRGDLEKLYKISDKVLDGNSSFSEAVLIADIALIDGKSGSSCEVPYLSNNLPIVYLSPRENLHEYFKEDIFSFGEFTNDPNRLYEKVLHTFKYDSYIEKRKSKIEYYLGKNDGNSTQRAIEAIKDIIK